MTDDQYDPYTAEQYGRLHKKANDFFYQGFPQKAASIREQMRKGIPFDKIKIPEDTAQARPYVRPETEVDLSLIEPPPRFGRGSSKARWLEFAKDVSDIEDEVLESLSRDEIIKVLEDRDIIDIVEE